MRNFDIDTDFDFTLNDPENFTEFSVDLETTGLDPAQGYRLRLFQCFLPQLNKVAVIDFWQPTEEQLIWFEKFLSRFDDPDTRWYFQNSLFDLYWIYYIFQRIPRGLIIDSMLISQLLKAGLFTGYKSIRIDSPSNLERLCIEAGIFHDKSYQQSNWGALELSEEQILYAARDSVVTYHIAEELYTVAMATIPDNTEAVLESIRAFVLLQYAGIYGSIETLTNIRDKYDRVCREEFDRLSKLMDQDPIHYKNKVLPRELELKELAAQGIKTRKAPIKPKPFNINSPAQLQFLMTEVFNIPKPLLEKDDATDEDDLTAAKNKIFEIVSLPEFSHLTALLEIARAKSLKKAVSTLDSYINAYDPIRKCVRTTYQVLATQGTGRSSSGSKNFGGVNCQNVSNYLDSHSFFNLPPIRSFCFAPEGWEFFDFDLDASHFQFARFFSQDVKMQESYYSGIKIHYYTMSSILKAQGKSFTPEDCVMLVAGKLDPGNQVFYKKLYKLSKNVIYSFLNFSGARTLQQTYFKAETLVSLEDCRLYLNACAEMFTGLRAYQLEKYNNALQTRRAIYTPDNYYLGQYVLIVPDDGRLIYIRCNQVKEDYHGNTVIKPKIPDVVAPHWLSPEGTVMERTLAYVANLQLDNPDQIKLANFSHDSFSVFVRKGSEKLAELSYMKLNENMSYFIRDYKPENQDFMSCKKTNWHK